MISEVRVGITVRRPRPEVASVFLEPRFLSAWLSGVRDVEVSGAHVALVGVLPGRQAEKFAIVDYRHDLALVLEGEKQTLIFELEGVPVGTVVWFEFHTKRAGLTRLLRPWLDYRERIHAIRDLRRLKKFVESGDYRAWVEDSDAAD